MQVWSWFRNILLAYEDHDNANTQVGAVDELDMATTRIRIRLPDEPISEVPQPNILEKCEIAQQMLKFTSDQMVGKNELRKKLGLYTLKALNYINSYVTVDQ